MLCGALQRLSVPSLSQGPVPEQTCPKALSLSRPVPRPCPLADLSQGPVPEQTCRKTQSPNRPVPRPCPKAQSPSRPVSRRCPRADAAAAPPGGPLAPRPGQSPPVASALRDRAAQGSVWKHGQGQGCARFHRLHRTRRNGDALFLASVIFRLSRSQVGVLGKS